MGGCWPEPWPHFLPTFLLVATMASLSQQFFQYKTSATEAVRNSPAVYRYSVMMTFSKRKIIDELDRYLSLATTKVSNLLILVHKHFSHLHMSQAMGKWNPAFLLTYSYQAFILAQSNTLLTLLSWRLSPFWQFSLGNLQKVAYKSPLSNQDWHIN